MSIEIIQITLGQKQSTKGDDGHLNTQAQRSKKVFRVCDKNYNWKRGFRVLDCNYYQLGGLRMYVCQ